jgi:hypothetical protein
MENRHPLLGFAILSHRQPAQLLRLVRKLSAMFDNPPISIHHDFSQCMLERNNFEQKIQFITPSIQTKWGHWSVSEAAVATIQHLNEREDSPEWIVLLSGNDYPIQNADEIKIFYENTSYDAFVSSKKLTGATLSTRREFYWFARYHWPEITYPSFFHLLKSIKKAKMIREPILLKEKWAQKFLTPFGHDYPCYGGSFWFSVNRKAAKNITDAMHRNKKLCKYYERVLIPEESFFVTVLNNAKDLRVYNFNYRFTDWAKNIGAHPKQLTIDDLPALKRAREHFARKIYMETDSDLLDALDGLTDS